MTGTDLAVRYPVPTAAEAQRLGELLAASGFFQDAREVAQAAVKVMAGAELGFAAVQSMTGIYIVKNRVTLSANLMAAAVKRSGRYNYKVREHDEQHAIIDFFENGELAGTSSFTMTDAAKAGLTGSDTWKKHPRNMLFARAMSNGAKWFCPDVFGGPVYVPEELGMTVDGDGELLGPSDALPPAGAPPSAVGEEGASAAPEATLAGQETPPPAPPVAPRLSPVSEKQENYLKGLIKRAQDDGMKTVGLRAILDQHGCTDVKLEPGWLRQLDSDQASKLIEVFKAGVTPTRDPAGEEPMPF